MNLISKNNSIDSLSDKIFSTQDYNKNLEIQNMELHQKLDSNNNVIISQNNLIDEQLKEITNLMTQIKNKNDKINTIELNVAELETLKMKYCKKMETANLKLEDNLITANLQELQILDLEKAASKYTREIGILETKLQESQVNFENIAKNNNLCRKEIEEKNILLNDKIIEITQLKNLNEEITSQMLVQKYQLIDLESFNSNIANKLDSVEKELDTISDKNNQLTQQIYLLNQTIEKKLEEINLLNFNQQEFQTKYYSVVSELESTNNELGNKINMIYNQTLKITELEASLHLKCQEFQVMQDDLKELKFENSDNFNKLNSTIKELENINILNNELSDTHKEFQVKLEAKVKDIEHLSSIIADLKITNSNLFTQLEISNNELSTKSLEIQALSNNLEELKSMHKSLLVKIDVLTNDNLTIKSMYDELKTEKKLLMNTENNLIDEIKKFIPTNNNKEVQINQLNADLMILESNNAVNKSKYESAKNEELNNCKESEKYYMYINELQFEDEEAKKKIDILNTDISSLKILHNDFILESENSKVKHLVSLTEYEKKIDLMILQIKVLENNLIDSKQSLVKLQHEKSDLENKLLQLEIEKNILIENNQELKYLKNENLMITSLNKELSYLNTKYSEEIILLKDNYEKEKDKIIEYKNVYKINSLDLEETFKTNEEYRNKIVEFDEVSKEIINLQEENTRLNKDVNMLVSNKLEMNMSVDKLITEKSLIELEFNKIKVEFEDCKQENSRFIDLNNELSILNEKYCNEISLLKSNLDKEKYHIIEFEFVNNQISLKLDEALKNNDELKSKIEKNENTIANLQKENKDLNKDIYEMISNTSEYEIIIKDHIATIEKQRHDQKALCVEIDSCKSIIKSYEDNSELQNKNIKMDNLHTIETEKSILLSSSHIIKEVELINTIKQTLQLNESADLEIVLDELKAMQNFINVIKMLFNLKNVTLDDLLSKIEALLNYNKEIHDKYVLFTKDHSVIRNNNDKLIEESKKFTTFITTLTEKYKSAEEKLSEKMRQVELLQQQVVALETKLKLDSDLASYNEQTAVSKFKIIEKERNRLQSIVDQATEGEDKYRTMFEILKQKCELTNEKLIEYERQNNKLKLALKNEIANRKDIDYMCKSSSSSSLVSCQDMLPSEKVIKRNSSKKSNSNIEINELVQRNSDTQVKDPIFEFAIPKVPSLKSESQSNRMQMNRFLTENENELEDMDWRSVNRNTMMIVPKSQTSCNLSNEVFEDSPNRILELQRRNTLCLPHLKSAYPIERFDKHPSENELRLSIASISTDFPSVKQKKIISKEDKENQKKKKSPLTKSKQLASPMRPRNPSTTSNQTDSSFQSSSKTNVAFSISFTPKKAFSRFMNGSKKKKTLTNDITENKN